MGIGSTRQVDLQAFFTIILISDNIVGSKCVDFVVCVTSQVSKGQLISVEVAKGAKGSSNGSNFGNKRDH